MSSQYVGDLVAQEQREWAEEQEWHDRESQSIPAWMDEEEITAREYEGEYEGDYEQESGPRVKPW